MNFKIYTDGACGGNPGTGGWAYLILHPNGSIIDECGKELQTTNNRMELTAIIKALYAMKQETDVESIIVYSDSAYVINCYALKWWKSWLANNWKTANKKPVKNQDLWEQLIPFFEQKHISFCKVEGHADDEYNNLVDKMAVMARCTQID